MQPDYPPAQQSDYPPTQPTHTTRGTVVQPGYHNGADPATPPNCPTPPGAPAPGPTSAAQELAAPVMVAGRQFALPYMTTMVMKGKNFLKLTSGNFEVHDSSDNLVLKVKGAFSLHTRRIIADAKENPIMTIKEKKLTVHKRWVAYRGDSSEKKDRLFSIRKSSLIQFTDNYSIYLAGNTSEDVPDFRVMGSFINRSCQIYLGESSVLLARMDEVYNLKTVVLGKDIFGVSVQPNVDYVFVIACIIVVFENEQG